MPYAEGVVGVKVTEHSASVSLTAVSSHVAPFGVIPVDGLVVKDRIPVGELYGVAVPAHVVCILGTEEHATSPVHVLEEPIPSGLGEHETVSVVGSVTMNEE